jgi:hypothetical protein
VQHRITHQTHRRLLPRQAGWEVRRQCSTHRGHCSSASHESKEISAYGNDLDYSDFAKTHPDQSSPLCVHASQFVWTCPQRRSSSGVMSAVEMTAPQHAVRMS